MNKRMLGATIALTLSGGVIGFAFAQAHQEGEHTAAISLADTPPAVRAAIARLTPDRNVKQIVRESDSRGRITFDVEYEAQGVESDAEISESGDLLELATHIDGDAIPPAARNAIAGAFPNSTIKAAEAKEVFFYEVVVTTAGQDRELIVTANGQIDDDDSDDDDDSEDDDSEDDDSEDDDSEDDDGDDDDGEDDDGEDDDEDED